MLVNIDIKSVTSLNDDVTKLSRSEIERDFIKLFMNAIKEKVAIESSIVKCEIIPLDKDS